MPLKIYEAHSLIGKLPSDLRDMVMKSKDSVLMLSGYFHLNLVKLQNMFADNDPDYDNENCTYKNENGEKNHTL